MRTRFAPSPTGPLHFGSVRTALFGWLAARHSGGSFVLRIEDTDQERYIPGSEALIVETLNWLGLEWDEGPEKDGPHDPYVQSLRIELYQEWADQLVQRGAAYWCTCAPARLAAMREEQRKHSQPTRYDRRCLGRQDEVAAERAQGQPAVLRLRMPDGTTEWDDVVRGRVVFDNKDIDDQVLLKSDGFPTYHLAVVVDDHVMDITHVIRSDEWIPSTPKHLAVYQALEWVPPYFAHVPAVLGPDGLKLSKRRGARNVLDYGELGYVPAAIVNAMAPGAGRAVHPGPDPCGPGRLRPQTPRRPQRRAHPAHGHRGPGARARIPSSGNEPGDATPPRAHAARAHGHAGRREASGGASPRRRRARPGGFPTKRCRARGGAGDARCVHRRCCRRNARA